VGKAVRILGIDPGLNLTGYGVIDFEDGKSTRVASGVLKVPAGELSERLGFIFEGILKVIDTYNPAVSAIEKTFLNTNAQSSMLLSHARGAAMCAPAARKIACCEYSTREIKKTVAGYGAAEKEQVKEMVRRLLSDATDYGFDESDALATALCHASHCRLAAVLPKVRATGVSATATARKGASRSRSRSAWTSKYEGKLS
jgi:crossover junction endodeoxyribonuclease RuvC